MPPLAWFGHDGMRSYETFLSIHSTRARGESRPISLCHTSSYADCRHPQDNIVIAVPDIPLPGHGRSFLCSTPTFFRPRLWFSQAPKMRALLDNCANLCLANKAFVLGQVLSCNVRNDFLMGMDGIGSPRTAGYVHLALYLDCISRVGGPICTVGLHLEIHFVEDLLVDLIVGMDAIRAYGVVTIISRSLATLSMNGCDLAFPIEFHRSKGSRDPA